jgi:iron complex outermembrane recepter protein
VLEKRNTVTNTRTMVLFTGDEASFLDDRLVIDLGLKQAFVSRHGENDLPSGPYATIHQYLSLYDAQTLPSLAATYKLNEHNSVFAGVSTSFRTPQNYSLFDSVNLTSTAYNNGLAPASKQKAEQAIQFEIGHRYQGELINTSASVFAYAYKNRQYQTSVIDPTSPGNTILENINVGNTFTYGADFEIGTRPIHNFRPYFSAELMSAKLQSDFQTTGTLSGAKIVDYLPTKGKYVPNAPEFQSAIGVDYDDGHVLGNFNVKYTGRQFSTLVNDQQIDGFAVANAMIGYRFEDFNGAKAPTLRLNLYNLADQMRLTQAATVTSNAASTIGRKGSTISSSTPFYYVGSGFAAIVTLSSGF